MTVHRPCLYTSRVPNCAIACLGWGCAGKPSLQPMSLQSRVWSKAQNFVFTQVATMMNQQTWNFQKPENAINRAEGPSFSSPVRSRGNQRLFPELIKSGQPFTALEALEAVLKQKRHRSQALTLEKAMLKYACLVCCVQYRPF